MKKPIIEIEELGQPNSLIYRQDAQISEIVNTEKMIKELNEQLRLHFVVGQSEQLKCRCMKDPLGSGTVLRCCDECAKSGKF